MLDVTFPSSLAWLSNACVLSRFSCVQFFVTLWTVACQAPLSLGFSRQEYWSGLLESSHPDWRVMVPHCGFDLHFSDNE